MMFCSTGFILIYFVELYLLKKSTYCMQKPKLTLYDANKRCLTTWESLSLKYVLFGFFWSFNILGLALGDKIGIDNFWPNIVNIDIKKGSVCSFSIKHYSFNKMWLLLSACLGSSAKKLEVEVLSFVMEACDKHDSHMGATRPCCASGVHVNRTHFPAAPS